MKSQKAKMCLFHLFFSNFFLLHLGRWNFLKIVYELRGLNLLGEKNFVIVFPIG